MKHYLLLSLLILSSMSKAAERRDSFDINKQSTRSRQNSLEILSLKNYLLPELVKIDSALADIQRCSPSPRGSVSTMHEVTTSMVLITKELLPQLDEKKKELGLVSEDLRENSPKNSPRHRVSKTHKRLHRNVRVKEDMVFQKLQELQEELNTYRAYLEQQSQLLNSDNDSDVSSETDNCSATSSDSDKAVTRCFDDIVNFTV